MESCDVVRLHGTDRTYTVLALYCTGALNPDEREVWARMRARAGHLAYWNVEKLSFEE